MVSYIEWDWRGYYLYVCVCVYLCVCVCQNIFLGVLKDQNEAKSQSSNILKENKTILWK